MAKGGITKGAGASAKAPSRHSRAARRATSPGIDTDKSLKNVKPPSESIDRRPAVLAAHHQGGIHKAKTGRKAVLSSKARKRQEKSMDRAEAIMDRTALKVQKSKGHAKVIQIRRKPWEEINKHVESVLEGSSSSSKKIPNKTKEELEADAAVKEFYAEEDQDGDATMEPVEEDDEEEEEEKPQAAQVTSAQPPPDDDDEIL
ncbi:Alb1-domain-containing protein [Diplogelasinospora grovesii]|uniref:Alb1-domain-containing protein n=1 Tax=Diplogelasinospora grovesii TaxID=303347 RepID=A0AAN6NFU9_9PEZI|nr:Alb1-domain-containing protein [Diplogelasinospora grovesii]